MFIRCIQDFDQPRPPKPVVRMKLLIKSCKDPLGVKFRMHRPTNWKIAILSSSTHSVQAGDVLLNLLFRRHIPVRCYRTHNMQPSRFEFEECRMCDTSNIRYFTFYANSDSDGFDRRFTSFRFQNRFGKIWWICREFLVQRAYEVDFAYDFEYTGQFWDNQGHYSLDGVLVWISDL